MGQDDYPSNQVVPERLSPNPYGIDWTEFFNMIQDKDLARYHRFGGLDGVARHLQCDLKNGGIRSDSVAQRTQVYGRNELPAEEEVTYFTFLKEALSDKMMLLLLALGTVALVIGLAVPEHCMDRATSWIDGGFIIIAVTLVVVATTVNDYLKELKFQALNAKTSKIPFHVRRDGERVKIDVAELVVGDMVEFSSGTQLPVDGLFISGQGVTIDESACTGENDEKKKKVSTSPTDTVKDKDPFIMSGTSVIAAEEGLFICVGVGENSFSGKLEMATRTGKAPTPLQEKLDALADTVGRIGITVAALLFITISAISLLRAEKEGKLKEAARGLLGTAIVGVSIIVVAVPEGLPLSVTIALAYSMSAMLKDNNMVRSLSACETMGAATNICSDKTGTLTTNQMTQTSGVIGGELLRKYDHNASGALRREDTTGASQKAWEIFCDAIAFNSSASQIPKPQQQAEGEDAPDAKDVSDDGLLWIGNKTEQGMLRFVKRAVPGGFQGIRDRLATKEDRFLFPFQSSKKSMTAIVRERAHPHWGASVMQYTKGASEVIVRHCTHYINAAGEQTELDDVKREEVENSISAFAGQGLRVIGIALRQYGGADEPFPEKDPFEPSVNLTLAGLSAIQDPVRTEVPAAVLDCKLSYVTVRMCTGDNIETAKAIAAQCGILEDDDPECAMIGPDFRQLFCDDHEGLVKSGEFMRRLKKLRVLARCSPLDKQLLVGNLMLTGEVVAVTGDGTNDAPALKLADVGFAMNIGTDVAKKASKIILLDNNFVSVVKACRWGRNVNDNIRKFVQFQFTVNVALLIVTFIGCVNDSFYAEPGKPGEPPLSAIHLLWCNIIMDTMAAMALSTENPHDGLMRGRKPTYRAAPLISRRMWRFILGSALYQLVVCLLLVFNTIPFFDPKEHPLDGDNVATLAPAWNFTGNETLPAPPATYSPTVHDECDDKDAMRARTVIFNVFVLMQVFNWFWARKLYDEVNLFEGMGRSPWFIPIVLFTVGFQVFMTEGVPSVLACSPPRPGGVWVGIWVIAFLVWPWGFAIRFIPVEEPNVKAPMIEEGDDVEDDGGGNAKLKMIQKVNRENLTLFGAKGKNRGKDVAINIAQGWKVNVGRMMHKHRVVRAFRGARGGTVGPKSGISVRTAHSSAAQSAMPSLPASSGLTMDLPSPVRGQHAHRISLDAGLASPDKLPPAQVGLPNGQSPAEAGAEAPPAPPSPPAAAQ